MTTHEPERAGRRWPRDVGAALSFAALAFWITGRLWLDPDQGLRANRTDQAFFEWILAHGARVATTGANPFFSSQMNAPDGVNLIANTSVLAISIPLAPVTLLLGPRTAFNVFLTAAMIATALAWYLVLSRPLGLSRGAAWVAATFCAFSPAMVSHANGHPNIVGQFVVPLIIWRTLGLRQARRWPRNGLILGPLIVWQAFINLEILLLTAIGLGVFIAVVAGLRPEHRQDWRPFLAGLTVAAVVAAGALAYPLYVLFAGPGSYHGLPVTIRGYGADLASFVAFAGESVAGDALTSRPLRQNPSEENAFFGWPLVVLVTALVVRLRRDAVVIGLATTGLLFALLSLGPRIRFQGRETDLPSLWALLDEVPVLDSVVPTRWALAITPVIGLLLGLGYQRALDLAGERDRAGDGKRPGDGAWAGAGPAGSTIRYAAATVLVMALLPIAPTPLPTRAVPVTPEFVSSGAWRDYTDGDRTVVTLPLADSRYPDPLRWSAETGLELPIPRGYFLGPNTGPDRPDDTTGRFSAVPRPTDRFFDQIRRTGRVPQVDDRQRATAVEDLRHWRAGVAVLAPQRYEEEYRRGLTDLIGIPPTRLGGVWIWDLRPIVPATSRTT